MKPLSKRMAMAVLCAATLTSPLLLSGCSMSELWQGTEQSRKEIAQRSEQDQVQLFNQYVKAVSRFNRMAVMFDYANSKKPMLFYAYDLDDYEERLRGLYFDFMDLLNKH